MLSSFRRKWPTFLKYAAIGATAFVFSAAPVRAQDAKQQQIDDLNTKVELQGQQIQKLIQLLEQKSMPAVVPVGMQPPAAASQPEDVRKVVEKVLKDKDDAKKAEDEKK